MKAFTHAKCTEKMQIVKETKKVLLLNKTGLYVKEFMSEIFLLHFLSKKFLTYLKTIFTKFELSIIFCFQDIPAWFPLRNFASVVH